MCRRLMAKSDSFHESAEYETNSAVSLLFDENIHWI